MEWTAIPHLEKKATRIGLGTWAIGGWMWGGSDETLAISTIHQALDQGLNFIDTAPVYGFGTSEEIVGKALKQYGQREKIVIATKVGLRWKDKTVYRDSSRASLLKEVEDSLRRLQVDYIDLYQVHWPDPSVSIEELATTLKELQKQGKIRAIGVSNFSTEQMDAFRHYTPLDALQPPFNLFEREIEQTELPYCRKNGIATVGYGSLCRGLLSGKLRKDSKFEGDDLRKIDPKFKAPRYSHYLEAADRLQTWVKDKYQKPLLALAVRWALDSGISIALWGARKPEQLKDMQTVWNWKLFPEDFEEIDRILQACIKDPIGPEFMAPPLEKPAFIQH
ncbi:aldo/keto reductase [Candidatus Protochlamydia phocaeensis]|uniref:aldo/keto reductase n=1 Tax=Candidatus Protochlamydia phocaeensis TaxID=1414722 RepID=UPI000838614A|nr:aldo/keto reductase [Candidatus Protochlamydia phocaeensis]